jgi:thiol:disulfide interchange protein/DsbC/DsbD-like thiol-disulfide interchange protein
MLRLVLLLAMLAPTAAFAVDADTPFAAQIAPAVPIAPGGQGQITVRYEVFQQHFLYRDMSSVTVVSAPKGVTVGEGVFPKGESKHDAVSESVREIYERSFDVTVPVQVADSVAPGSHDVTLKVAWQGCNKPENYCLFPVRKEVVTKVTVAAPSKGAGRLFGLVGTAFAGGKAFAPPGLEAKAPAVSFDGLPDTADVQPIDMDEEEHPVRARLLLDRTAATPGETLRVGVHLTPREHWHTYWKSPGQIGKPTKIEWSLPEGVTAAPFEFPLPHKFDQEGILSYGYDGPVLLFSEIEVPADASGEWTLGAKAEWLVCEVMCIQGSAELSRTVAVGPGEPSAHAPLFDHYAAQHPTPIAELAGIGVESALTNDVVRPDDTFNAAFRIVSTDGKPLKATQVEGAEPWPTFAPLVQFSGEVWETKVEQTEDGALLATMELYALEIEDLPEGEVVGGLFQFQLGDQLVRTEVTAPITWAAKGAAAQATNSPLFGTPDVAEAAAEGASSEPVAEAAEAEPAADAADAANEVSAAWMLLLAFFGGVLLNVMPCVLPVLTMKLYSLIQQGDISNADRRLAGYAYSAGIIASFVALGLAVVLLKGVFGQSVGWGFQFQSPVYVAVLATIVFAFGLSLFGVFEVPALGANQAAQASAKEGAFGYFLTGVFATLLATPCSAPFLGTGMGFALSLPTAGVLLFFAVAGFGLAFPFLVIALVPALFRFLPKPGAWMDAFKQLMGFSLVATTVWLVYVLGKQVGIGTLASGMTGFMMFLTVVGMAAWIFGRFGGPMETGKRQLAMFGLAVALSVGAGTQLLDLRFAETGAPTEGVANDVFAEAKWAEEIPWQAFSEDNVAALQGEAVFIDFTADWCLTCKVNEKTILSTDKVRGRMRELGVYPLKADWTRKDETITRWLQDYGKAGVPFYLVLPADPAAKPIPLPEVITADLVIDAMQKAAGPSTMGSL